MADAPTIEKEKGSWLSFFTKLLFFFIVLMAVGIMMLTTLGGNSDVLKGSIEDYLSSRFGGRAEIETFNRMTFYPYMGVDMAGVKVFEGDSETKTRFSADKVVMAMGFWDLSFGTGKLKTFDIENMKAAPGALIAQGLTVDKAAIIDEGDQAYIRSTGKIGTTPYSFESHVETFGKGNKKKYAFGDVRPFDARLGDIDLKGRIEDMDVDTMSVKELSIGLGQPLLGGDLNFYYGGDQRMKIKGDITLGQGSKARADILIESNNGTKISGSLDFSEMLLDDALDYELLVQLSDKIQSVIGEKSESNGYDFSGVEIDASASVDKLIHNNVVIGSLRAPVRLSGGDLHVGPIESGFQQSKLSSDIHFNTAEKPAKLEYKLSLKNWDYGPVQNAFHGRQDVKGRADIKIDLSSSGNSDQELKDNLKGSMSLIAGKAEFPAATLNFWGSGLLNAILPDFNPDAQTTLNCAIADFTVEEGIAKSNALFLDTIEVTLSGAGEYDFAKDDLDITLKPKPKSVAIGDISTAVNIEGPIASPSIGPSAFDLGKKLGGLALGLVNPAFLAYSLTDLGLSDAHPCAEFITGKETKTE